jgi:ribosome-binding factor A
LAKAKEPSQRQLRVGEEIRHMLSDIFLRGDYSVKKLDGISITVTEVDVSPDLRNATAYISPMGGKLTMQHVAGLLNTVTGDFNRQIAKKLTMKFAPRLRFSEDTRLEYAAKIEALLQKANKE